MANAVYKNEMKANVRSVRFFLVLFAFNSILSALSFLAFAGIMNQSRYFGQISGLTNIYSTMAYIELAMFMLIIPTITAGSITGEKERKTLDLLLISKMTPFSIIIGKLEAAIHIVRILAISSLPVLSIVFIFGGIQWWDLFILLLTLIITGFFLGSIGIFFSTISRRTTTSTVLTYFTIIILVFGTYGCLIFIKYLDGNSMSIFKNGIGKGFYCLLFNPAITYGALISEQVQNANLIQTLAASYAPLEKGWVIENWVLISLTIQILLSILFILLSAWLLNPRHEIHFRKCLQMYR
ncbi:MAG: ABC transporter permease subunit [Lachnospiraceae bacterium]|nr:ABC transporter permease subunit [Lachnospiraceae bacterium]